MIRLSTVNELLMFVCCLAAILPRAAIGEDLPVVRGPFKKSNFGEKEPKGKDANNKSPRSSWLGVDLYSYWPAVGIEYPPQPNSMSAPYHINYDSLYDYAILPAASIPKEKQKYGSEFSWLREDAYDQLGKLQSGEMNERYVLDGPWKLWKEAIVKNPKTVQQVVSVRHNRIFSKLYGDALYDYPLEPINGWRMRFVLETRAAGPGARNPVRIELLRRKDIPSSEVSEVAESCVESMRLGDVNKFVKLVDELPLANCKFSEWKLVDSRTHHDSEWMEATFSGRIAEEGDAQLTFIIGPKGILVSLEGASIRLLGTDHPGTSITNGNKIPKLIELPDLDGAEAGKVPDPPHSPLFP